MRKTQGTLAAALFTRSGAAEVAAEASTLPGDRPCLAPVPSR
jgi:hypothetical protein